MNSSDLNYNSTRRTPHWGLGHEHLVGLVYGDGTEDVPHGVKQWVVLELVLRLEARH